MKQVNIFCALLLSSVLVGCGGGASSASDKPTSLLPSDFVLISSSSSSQSSSGSASNSSSGLVTTALPIYENFEAVDIDGFFSADYKHLSTDTTLPFYYATSGYPVSTNPGGVPRILLTNWTSKALWFGNSRFTIGQTRLEHETTTADPTIPTWGELDLSKAYRISFCVKDAKPLAAKHFIIYVDNNTSNQANSINGNPNRIYYADSPTLVPGQRVVVESSVGTAKSFLQFRVESSADVIIDDLVIEYQNSPYTGSIPACVADASFVRPVATSSSASSVISSVASSAASSSVSSLTSSVTSSVASSSASSIASSVDTSSAVSSVAGSSVSSIASSASSSSVSSASSVVSSAASSDAASSAASGTTKNWGFDSAAYALADTTLFAAAYSATVDNNIKATSGDVSVDGLTFNSTAANVIRYRPAGSASNASASPLWNTNGSFFTANSVLMPAVAGDVDTTKVRTYIAVPVTAGTAFTITMDYKQTGSGATAAKVALMGSDNKVLVAKDASFSAAGTGDTITLSVPAGHAYTSIKILYGREGITTGGINITNIQRVQ